MSSTTIAQSAFIRACHGESVPYVPVWFMRQAGRSLPEYRRVRDGVPMLAACRRPELVCEITLQPVRRHGVDAAILFSDIVVPLAAAGVDVDIVPGVGPVVGSPVRDRAGVDRLPALDPGQVDFVGEAIRLLRAELGDTPLIGFAGAPFTLASYLVEGGPSRHHGRTKALMAGAPVVWHALCARLAAITREFLRVQVAAGVAAVQLFDSWAGALSEADYREYVQPHSAAVLGGLTSGDPAPGDLSPGDPVGRGDVPGGRAGPGGVRGGAVPPGPVPRIHFGVGTGHLLSAMAQAGADVLGVDWRTPLDVAAATAGPGVAVQGNLDPALLFAPWEVVERQALRVLAEGRTAPGHIFNLGHGVLPETDPDRLTRLVDLVHRATAR